MDKKDLLLKALTQKKMEATNQLEMTLKCERYLQSPAITKKGSKVLKIKNKDVKFNQPPNLPTI